MAITSMNLAAQKKSSTDEGPCTETKDDDEQTSTLTPHSTPMKMTQQIATLTPSLMKLPTS
jgi:hypothetical protein